MASNVDDLIARLSNITNFVSDADISDSNGVEEDPALVQKLQFYHDLANSQERKVDPKIIKQRQSLPIYKRKDELIEVY